MSMPAWEVKSIYKLIEVSNLNVWLDGSWAVNSLLRELKYDCSDLDIVVELKDRDRASDIICSQGYNISGNSDPTSKRKFKHTARGYTIEMHLVTRGQGGEGVRVIRGKKDIRYEPPDFEGKGLIEHMNFRSLSAEALARQYSSFTPNDQGKRLRNKKIIEDLRDIILK